MARPQTIYEFAPTSTPDDPTPTWVDISQWVRGHTVTRGRESELDRFDAGTLDLLLDNRDRRFDCTLTTGPYGANLKTWKQIRVRRLYGGGDYPVFHGYIEGWPQTWDLSGNDATVTLTAADGFSPVSRYKLPDFPDYAELITVRIGGPPLGYWRMNDREAGWTGNPANTLLNEGVGTDGDSAVYANVPSAKAPTDFKITGSIVGDSNARMYFDRPGASNFADLSGAGIARTWEQATLECWFEPTDTSDSNVIVLNVGALDGLVLYAVGSGPAAAKIDTNVGSAAFAVGTTNLAVGTVYHLVVTWDGITARLFVNGVEEDNVAITGTFTATDGNIAGASDGIATSAGYYDEVAVYSYALFDWQVMDHYRAGADGVSGFTQELTGSRVARLLGKVGLWSAASEVDAGTVDVEGIRFTGQTIRGEIELVEDSEDGTFFVDREGRETFLERDWQTGQSLKATFGNVFGALPFRNPKLTCDDSFQFNSWSLTRPGDSVPRTFEDVAAGDFTFTRDRDTLLTSDADVDDLGDILLARYKEPMNRVRGFEVKPLASAALTAAALDIELRDLVAVTIQPEAGGAEIEQESYVERIVDTESPSDWTVEYGVSPR